MHIEKSIALQDKSKRLIPGGTQLLSKRPDMFCQGSWPGYYARAKGAYVWDLDGNKYLDMSIGGIGATVLGYADDDVDNAVKEAIDKGVASSLNCPEEVELAELLCELHPWADMARFARTGGEAMAIAVRIARARTGRDKVAFCGYHGWHDWYLAANIETEDALDQHLLEGLQPTGVPKCLTGTALSFRYNHLTDLEKIASAHGSDIGTIVIEPIRNYEPEDGFLEGVRQIADKLNAVLIVDEISAGFRYLTGGAHLKFGLKPDMAVFSKAMGNGYAIAAVIGEKSVMDAAQDSFISSTCWTERIGPAAALATIDKHRKYDVGKHLLSLGIEVQAGWRELGQKHDIAIDISGIPQLSHFAFSGTLPQHKKAFFVQEMLEYGILASTIYYPMLSHTLEDICHYLHAVGEVFGLIARLEDDMLCQRLRARPATCGFTRLA